MRAVDLSSQSSLPQCSWPLFSRRQMESPRRYSQSANWAEVPWNTYTYGSYNGDGQLVYPRPNGKLFSSIRFECMRDGIEDCECFYMLNELARKAAKDPKTDPALLSKARKLLTVSDDVVKSLTEYTQDPNALLKYRQAVAQTIERLENAR